MAKYKLQDNGKIKPNPLADINSDEYKLYLAKLRSKFPEAKSLGVQNTYDNKYNGGGVQGMDSPTELQQILNMVEYMKNNNSSFTDRPSNIYRPEWEHNSINNPQITNDAKYGGMKKKKKYAVGGAEPTTFEEWLQQTGQELLEGSEGKLYQQYQTFLKAQPSGYQLVKDKSQLDFSGGFKALNFGLDVTNFIGGFVNNVKAKKQERYEYEKAKYPKAKQNLYEDGLNNVPVVYKDGGEASKTEVELEKGEVFQTHEGEIKKVPESEKTHEQGGSDQKFVFRVLEDTADKRKDINSKLLQIQPIEAEELIGVKIKKPTTHSKLYEEAIKFYDKKLNKIEKGLQASMDYTKLSKDRYGINSVDANNEFLATIPSKGEIFDIIFEHQENVKQMFDIKNVSGKNKYGGKYAVDGENDYPYSEDPNFKPKKPYRALPKGYGDKKIEKDYIDKYNALNGTNLKTIDQVQKHRGATYPELVQDYYKQDGVLPTNKHLKVFGTPQVDFDVADPTKVLQGDNDGLWGNRQILPVKQQFANEEEWLKFVNNRPIVNSNGQQFVYNNDNTYITPEFGGLPNNQRTPAELIKTEREPLKTDLKGTSVTEPQPAKKYTSNSQIAGQTKASRFNEPLRWWDVGGDFMALLQNMERIPVPLEQLDRQPLRYREQSPLPTIQQGQEDFGSIVSQLPQNQLGFANTANLYGKKYSLNNQVFGQYENINKTGYNNTEMQNNNNQFQLDGANLQLRDQFNNRVLQGKATQQENKLAIFNNLLTKVAQNRAFNRNGNLLMQTTPFFNQYGEFNGNKYNIAPQTAQSVLPQEKYVKKFNATTRKYEYVKAS
jgi:hypothetical protein